jgi:hypothetical protein
VYIRREFWGLRLRHDEDEGEIRMNTRRRAAKMYFKSNISTAETASRLSLIKSFEKHSFDLETAAWRRTQGEYHI